MNIDSATKCGLLWMETQVKMLRKILPQAQDTHLQL